MDRRIAASLCLVLAGVANAQPDRLGSYTIDGGGGSLTGPTYTLSGTVGQPDAGVLTGATYTLIGGFWGAMDPGPPRCNPADLNEPFGVLDLSDINAFVSGFLAQDPVSDLSPPIGVFDLADINTFVGAFLAGCP